jgi:hypothetical protein
MRSTPNYFKFRQWLGMAMKNDPLGDDHFHADDVYQNNFLKEHEDIPATFILSYGALMLEDARKYFQKHTFSVKTPVFFCGLKDLENYDPNNFEYDYSMPDFSTLEKSAALCTEDVGSPQIFFYVTRSDIWQTGLSDHYKFICVSVPSWFGSQFNMIYRKTMYYTKTLPDCFVLHDITFYHSDSKDYYPFDMSKWYSYSGVLIAHENTPRNPNLNVIQAPCIAIHDIIEYNT